MDDSPFVKLPAEIRNQIYSLAMPNVDRIRIIPARGTDKSMRGQCRGEGSLDYHIMQGPPALTRTCRQIREESTLLFYATESFTFATFKSLQSFIKAIGDQKAKAMKGAKIEFYSTTTIDQNQPARPNVSARARLDKIVSFAKKYGWTSLKLEIEFQASGFYHYTQFDVMQPEKDWEGPELNCGRNVEIAKRVNDQIKAWKVALAELRGRA